MWKSLDGRSACRMISIHAGKKLQKRAHKYVHAHRGIRTRDLISSGSRQYTRYTRRSLWFAATFQIICKTVIQVTCQSQDDFINTCKTKLGGRLFSKCLRTERQTNIV
jgi:hypothetical protein